MVVTILIFTNFYCDHCDFHFTLITVSIFLLIFLDHCDHFDLPPPTDITDIDIIHTNLQL